MLSFREFYAKKFTSNQTELRAEELLSLLPKWVFHLRENIAHLKKRRIIPLKTADDLDEALYSWKTNPLKNISEPLSLEKIDRIYESFLNFLASHIRANPRKLEIPYGYPFGKHASGVKMEARILLEELSGNSTFVFQTSTESTIGSSSNKKNIFKIKNISWLSEICSFLQEKPPLPHPAHAETMWFFNHSQKLVDDLRKDLLFASLPLLSDRFPEMQLAQIPRLEIITSTACCREYCQPLFSALRLYLNAYNINLPIVLYAGAAYNDAAEVKGSVYVINSKGEFCDTKLQCNLGQEQLPLPGDFRLEISTQQQQDYACLARIGGIAIIELMKLPVSEAIMVDINPITYLAPDSLIIYAADIALNNPKAPENIKKLVSSLLERLDNMDTRMLTIWRMSFLDQLHWLLVSSLDSRYREAARSRIDGTRCITVTTKEALSQQDEFCSSFVSILEKFRLNDVYKEMLEHFTERDHARMPFGCLIGPLSNRMIKNCSNKFSRNQIRYLLWNRNRPTEKQIEQLKKILLHLMKQYETNFSMGEIDLLKIMRESRQVFLQKIQREMREFLSQLQLEIKDVAADGNCFFHAVSDQMMQRCDLEYSAKELRTLTADYILEHADEFEGVMRVLSCGNPAAYFKRLFQDREWADNLIILGLSKALDVELKIIQNDGSIVSINSENSSGITLYIGYYRNLHYFSLRGEAPNIAINHPPFHNAMI